MTNDPKNPQILISDRDSGLPYSKGLMASQVMVTGLSPVRAYQVAEAIEERLRELGVPSISSAQLGELALGVLEDLAGERYARNFQRWREVEALEVPLVVLIGGATGVGKSTLATQLATRLGIVRVVATDAIREVMRALFSHELMPTLHASSFEAGSVLREPPSKDEVVVGFREQTAAVAVGVQALVERAAMEGTHLIIEGAHVVPGLPRPRAVAGADPRGSGGRDDRGGRAAPQPLRGAGLRTHRATVAAVPRPVRRHPARAALHQEPGAVARRPGDRQLQLRSRPGRDHRSRDGASDRTNVAGPDPGGRRLRSERERASGSPRQRCRRSKEAERETVPGHRQHRGDPRDQPVGRTRRRDHQPLAWSRRRTTTPSGSGRRSCPRSRVRSRSRRQSSRPNPCTSRGWTWRRWRRTPSSRCR